MSTSFINPAICNRSPLVHISSSHYNSMASNNKRSSIFGSLKDKVSRKNSMNSQKGNDTNPFVTSPATRRPDRPGMNAFTTPSNEPPPAYTPSASTPLPSANLTPAPLRPSSSASNASHISTSTPDDPYAFLSRFDTVFLIDDSGSMGGARWRECSAALEAITPICTAHDKDGIDIYFLNAAESRHHKNVKLASTVHEIFSTVKPGGITLTQQRLTRIIKEYMRELRARGPDKVRPMNIIVITDGAPSDDPATALIDATKDLDAIDANPWQLGVQFVQIGQDAQATEHLNELDDNLVKWGATRDIVDTVPFGGHPVSAEMILKVVLGAVNKRLDRHPNPASPSK